MSYYYKAYSRCVRSILRAIRPDEVMIVRMRRSNSYSRLPIVFLGACCVWTVLVGLPAVFFLIDPLALHNLVSWLSESESFETYLDRNGICDRLSRGLIGSNELHVLLIYACGRWSSAQRNYFRLRESRVNQFDPSRLTIAGEHICTNDTFMIVLVHSLHDFRARRDAIRRTWGGATVSGHWPTIGSTKNINTKRVRVAFVFGQMKNDVNAELALRHEGDLHGDVIQGQFYESYYNVVLKSLTGLHWASEYCPSARVMFKCDDDMFINVPAILDVLSTENMTRTIIGPYNGQSRVHRKGKWGLSFSDYPFYYYPPYVSGSGYGISADLWRPLLNAANRVPHVHIEDVYVTGILGRVVGVRHVTRTGFAYWTSEVPKSCAIADGTVLTGTNVEPDVMPSMWADLHNDTIAGC